MRGIHTVAWECANGGLNQGKYVPSVVKITDSTNDDTDTLTLQNQQEKNVSFAKIWDELAKSVGTSSCSNQTASL